MKVGDVVCLSEYGIARVFNRTITNVDPYQVGVIVEIPGQVTTAAQGDIVEVASCAPVKVTT